MKPKLILVFASVLLIYQWGELALGRWILVWNPYYLCSIFFFFFPNSHVHIIGVVSSWILFFYQDFGIQTQI